MRDPAAFPVRCVAVGVTLIDVPPRRRRIALWPPAVWRGVANPILGVKHSSAATAWLAANTGLTAASLPGTRPRFSLSAVGGRAPSPIARAGGYSPRLLAAVEGTLGWTSGAVGPPPPRFPEPGEARPV